MFMDTWNGRDREASFKLRKEGITQTEGRDYAPPSVRLVTINLVAAQLPNAHNSTHGNEQEPECQ